MFYNSLRHGKAESFAVFSFNLSSSPLFTKIQSTTLGTARCAVIHPPALAPARPLDLFDLSDVSDVQDVLDVSNV